MDSDRNDAPRRNVVRAALVSQGFQLPPAGSAAVSAAPLPACPDAVMTTSNGAGSPPPASGAGAASAAQPGGWRQVLANAASGQGGAKPPPMGAPPSPESNGGLGDDSLPSTAVASQSIGERVRTGLGRRAAAMRQALGARGGLSDGDAGDVLETSAVAPAAPGPPQICAEPGCGRPAGHQGAYSAKNFCCQACANGTGHDTGV